MIIEVLSPLLYVIKGRKKEKVVHHDRIKLCKDRVIPLWISRMRNKFLQGEEMTDEEELVLPEEVLNLDKLFHDLDNDQVEEENQENVPELAPAAEVPRITSRGRTVKAPSHLRTDYVL